MNPTKQTILHDPANGLHGNCLSAVLASLLHLPIEDVPLFKDHTWVIDLNAWLRKYGLAYCMVEDFDCHIDAYGIKGLWHEVSGNTRRSKDVLHACVAKDGNLVFDPHPDDSGIKKITCSRLKRCSRANAIRRADLFCEGWVIAVSGKIHAMVPGDKQQLAITSYLQINYPSLVDLKAIDRSNGRALRDYDYRDRMHGMASGQDTELNRGVGAAEQELLN